MLLKPVFDGTNDVIWNRDGNGDLQTNVEHRVVWHSRDGFEVDYPGSGPAEFALNILEAMYPYCKTEYIVTCDKGTCCSQFAADYHQDFKWKFLSGNYLPGSNMEKGSIPINVLQDWIASRLAKNKES